jgi:cell division transport system permease protein
MIWRRPRLDLPLERDGSGRFLTLIIALMVYLAGLALAAALLLTATAERWDRGLAGTLTVQLPADQAAQMGPVLALLRASPGIAKATPLDQTRSAALLEPWLGSGPEIAELPLPRLIDVRITPGERVDLDDLRRRLADTAPGAALDDHRRWLDPLLRAAAAIRLAAAAVLVLVAGAAVLTVVFTTRAGLAVHHGVIEVLHLIGARDGYVARQFERQALRLGFRGGLVGLGLAVLTLAGVLYAGRTGVAPRLLPTLSFGAVEWLALAALPFGAALVAMLTARLTVLRALRRLP